MRLLELLNEIEYKGQIMTDSEVERVTCDSRRVEAKTIFVCINGTKLDGHDKAYEAIENGAVLIVTQRDLGLRQQIIVPNTRYVYGLLCSKICGEPSKKLKLIAVTGTNGKTTITNILRDIIKSTGKKCGLIGTIHNEVDDMSLPSKHTTPDPAELHVLLSKMLRAGCQYVVMEASSHALDQYRLAGCEFEAGIFTNLTQDHLDYHGTMDNYFEAKKKLFDFSKVAIINYDDEYGRRLLEELECKKVSFSSFEDEADYTAKDIRFRGDGTDFAFVGKETIGRVHFAMPGLFSVSNAMAAITCAIELGFDLDVVLSAINKSKGVKGRAEVLPTGRDFTIICDYAHTPDGLEKIISAVKDYATGRVVTLFGCAGQRDKTKRPKMGEVVSKLSDFVILTSDNPRGEDPLEIIEDTLPGVKAHKTPYKVIADRHKAIEWALTNAKTDDIIILAGKGHEDYQVLDDCTIYFDEHEIVKEILSKM